MDGSIFWNARALHYKDFNEINTLPPALTLANMLEIYGVDDVLEVACASGLFTIFHLCNLENVKNFISVDVSEVMIELAEERKANTFEISKRIRHEFKVGDAQDLSFIQDESMDIYVSNMCIHMISDQVKFLKEAKRVLRMGGKIGLSVPCREDGMMNLFGKNLKGISHMPPLPNDPWSLGSKDKLTRLLQENGFQVRFCWEDHFKLPYYNDDYIDFQINHGEAKAFCASLTPEQKMRFRENVIRDFYEMKQSFVPLQMKLISIVAVKTN